MLISFDLPVRVKVTWEKLKHERRTAQRETHEQDADENWTVF